jgi:hypothetical protein
MSNPPITVSATAKAQLKDRSPAFGKSATRTMATPQGPKKLANAAAICCNGVIGASSGLAIKWMIVKGKLITNPVMAQLASSFLVVTRSCLSVLR